MKKYPVKPLYILLGGILLTLPFVLWPLDIGIERFFYNTATGSWPWANAPFWSFLYRYGPLVLWVPGLIALIYVVISFFNQAYLKYRLPALFFLATLALGPGYLVNGTLKEYMGRPRPREVTELGGNKTFLYPLEPGRAGNGQSFPSGHATTGFALIGLAYALKERNRKQSRAVFAFAIFWGFFMGLGRMVQGGHFPSDVLWSGVVCWASAAFLYDVFLRRRGKPPLSTPAKSAATGIVLLMLLQMLFATANNRSYRHQFSPSQKAAVLKIEPGDLPVVIKQNKKDSLLTLDVSAQSIGAIDAYLRESTFQNGDTLVYRYKYDRFILWQRGEVVINMDTTRNLSMNATQKRLIIRP